MPVLWTDLTVRHTGHVDKAIRARKPERDIKILNCELEDRPDDPFILFNLGAIAIERRDWHEALGFLERSLAGSAPTDSIVRKLFALIARAHEMLDDSQAALRTCAAGSSWTPGTLNCGSVRRSCTDTGVNPRKRSVPSGGSWACGVPTIFAALIRGSMVT